MTAREIIMALPSKFDASKVAADADTTFHFKVNGDNGGEYTAVIKDGKCEVSEGLVGEAKCVVTTTAEMFSDIIERRANPQMAVFSGKLKISNLGEMMKYAKVFGLM
jgi:putative sterol carrier protein